MYSLYDITRVFPKIEPDTSLEMENHDHDVADRVASLQGPTSLCKADSKHVLSTFQLESAEKNGSYEVSTRENVAVSETFRHDSLSSDQPIKGDMRIHEELSRHNKHEMVGKDVFANETRSVFQNGGNGGTSSIQMGTHEATLTYQTGTDWEVAMHQGGTHGGILPYETGSEWMSAVAQMGSHGTFLPYQTYTDRGVASPRADTRAIVSLNQAAALKGLSAVNTRQACHCFCHVAQSSPSHLPAFGSHHQRPSVIMVPTKWRETGSFKDDCDSSDAGEDEGNHERYFRRTMDGTTAKFKLSKEDWERIPINTFPSGGRLLSGDWTRIFLSKVKESNPWCSLRFKNNHVRSENSRKIHSAVFFRGGAECKRPECDVKVRFVIRKEKGKYVEVTYVGNVCHSSQPGGSDVTNDKRRSKRVRKPRYSSD